LFYAIENTKLYPTESTVNICCHSILISLVEKHPCLIESTTCTKTGYDGWRNNLQFKLIKMGNCMKEMPPIGLPNLRRIGQHYLSC